MKSRLTYDYAGGLVEYIVGDKVQKSALGMARIL